MHSGDHGRLREYPNAAGWRLVYSLNLIWHITAWDPSLLCQFYPNPKLITTEDPDRQALYPVCFEGNGG